MCGYFRHFVVDFTNVAKPLILLREGVAWQHKTITPLKVTPDVVVLQACV